MVPPQELPRPPLFPCFSASSELQDSIQAPAPFLVQFLRPSEHSHTRQDQSLPPLWYSYAEDTSTEAFISLYYNYLFIQ